MLGKTLVIVNPVARSGKAAEVAAAAATVFERMEHSTAADLESVTFRYTACANDAARIAAQEGAEFDTVIGIGGDGVVHEIVNGLMQLPFDARPVFGLVPCGNGDDFARSIGMARKPEQSLAQLEQLAFRSWSIDVGSANGQWFAQTLSFGLDAAIALGTHDLRKKTNRTGTSLYVQCALDQLINHRDIHSGTVSFDGAPHQPIDFYLLAIQNGPSYGGGFKICPKARLDDGMFDICWAKPTLTAPAALKLLASAKGGNHEGHKNIAITQAQQVQLKLHAPVATQIDGEELTDLSIDIALHPRQLNVLIAESAL